MARVCQFILILATTLSTTLLRQVEQSYQNPGNMLPTLPGTIAYISPDYNVYSVHPQTNQRIALTTDGNRAQPYTWPTWSTDGRLAYFLLDTNSSGQIETNVYITENGLAAGNLAYTGIGELFTYAYWSPQNCSRGQDCRNLAVLMSRASGLGVELVRDASLNPATDLIGSGGPFYYSWSPDGNRMLWQRDNQHIQIYDVARDEITDTVSERPGSFLAPAWSPVDDRLLFGVQNEDGQTTDLVVQANGETKTLAAELQGIVRFAWSPDGNEVSYTSEDGALHIVDAVTGGESLRTGDSGVLAFFWSPDSNHIAYITLAAPAGSINAKQPPPFQARAITQRASGLAWTVVDVANGNTRSYGSFIPTDEMLYLLTYFDQFSQSHRLWSPDSHYLLYSEITPDAHASINILETTQADVVPFSIAEGLIGVWSFN